MEQTPAFDGLVCPDCGTRPEPGAAQQCPDCDGRLQARYDYEAVSPTDLFEDSQQSGEGQWRFNALLPFERSTAITAAEGATPLVETERLAEELGVESVSIKDEGRNPTGTVYDRGMSLAVTAISGHDDPSELEPLALASTGNSGQSAAAYVGRLGLRSYSFVP